MENELYNISEAEIEEFDQLYDGTIDEEDYYLLMARMELDEVLKHKYTVYKLLRNEIELDGISVKVLKSRLQKLDKQMKIRKITQRFWIGLSISVVIILVFSMKYILTNSKGSIYEKYRFSEPGLPIIMEESSRTALDSAMVYIGSNQFETAYKKLDFMHANDTVLYYKAFSLEQLNSFKNAEALYHRLENSKSQIIREKSQFRLALLSFALNDSDPYNRMKIIASDSNHMYKQLAKEILTSVK